MKVGAVICELNPLHDGHKYIFKKAKEDCDVVIAVMSGNFVQRGETAIYDKYKRACDIVGEFADVCLEIPFPFSCSSAEFFAKSGVHIAESAGATDLYFGSESGNTEDIKQAAHCLNKEAYKQYIKDGRPAQRREEYLRENCKTLSESIYNSPNDILATEYARFAKINLHAVKRIKTKSATEIRKELISANENITNPDKLQEIEFLHFRSARNLEDTFDGGGGLLNYISKCSRLSNNYKDFWSNSKTKNYTDNRIKRASLFSLMGVTAEDVNNQPEFTNALCANSVGLEYLSKLNKKDKGIKILSRASDSSNLSKLGKCQFELNARADEIYTLCSCSDNVNYFIKKHIIVK